MAVGAQGRLGYDLAAFWVKDFDSIQNGDDISLTNSQGKTPVQYAERRYQAIKRPELKPSNLDIIEALKSSKHNRAPVNLWKINHE